MDRETDPPQLVDDGAKAVDAIDREGFHRADGPALLKMRENLSALGLE